MPRTVIMMALCAWLTTACATNYYTAPTPAHQDTDIVVDRSYDLVWRDLIAFFADLNVPIRTIERASGIIATEYGLDGADYYLDCGRATFPAMLTRPPMNINVTARADGENRTIVHVNVFGRAELVLSTLTAPQEERCESTGAFERAIARAVHAQQ